LHPQQPNQIKGGGFMKLIELIVKRIFTDFVKNAEKLRNEANLYTDLNLSRDNVKNIRNRIEQIFSVRIPEDSFMKKSTYGGIVDFVQILYIQAIKLTEARLN
jgi:acyl carrier protein